MTFCLFTKSICSTENYPCSTAEEYFSHYSSFCAHFQHLLWMATFRQAVLVFKLTSRPLTTSFLKVVVMKESLVISPVSHFLLVQDFKQIFPQVKLLICPSFLFLYSGDFSSKRCCVLRQFFLFILCCPHLPSCLLPPRAASWTALHARRRKQRWHQRQRRGEQRKSGRADYRRGQAAGVHRGHWRRLLGHPHGLQCLDLLQAQEEEGAEPLRRLLRLHTSRSAGWSWCGMIGCHWPEAVRCLKWYFTLPTVMKMTQSGIQIAAKGIVYLHSFLKPVIIFFYRLSEFPSLHHSLLLFAVGFPHADGSGLNGR